MSDSPPPSASSSAGDIAPGAAPCYTRRRSDPAFAAAWDRAKARAAARLVALGMKQVRGLSPGIEPVADITDAIWLLREHKSQRAGMKRRGWRPAPLPSPEEVRASILRKIDAIVRGRAKGYLPIGALIRVKEDSG